MTLIMSQRSKCLRLGLQCGSSHACELTVGCVVAESMVEEPHCLITSFAVPRWRQKQKKKEETDLNMAGRDHTKS